jgi:hypothetical protein
MIGLTSRRGFLRVAGAAVAACAARTPRPAMPPPAYKAVAFDGFALFDPTPITSLATRLFEAKGARLDEAWRVKQFDYQWLRAVSGRYQDFLPVRAAQPVEAIRMANHVFFICVLLLQRSHQHRSSQDRGGATPGVWISVPGFPLPVTDATGGFLIKDLFLLGAALVSTAESLYAVRLRSV